MLSKPAALQVYPTDGINSSLGEGAAAAHLRSKEALLALLHSRMLDKVSAPCRQAEPGHLKLVAVMMNTPCRGVRYRMG